MKWFSVYLNARNFYLDVGNGPAPHGFYTTRIVSAPDPATAEQSAVDAIRSDERLLDLMHNGPDDPVRIFVVEIEEISSDDAQPAQDAGLAWYPESKE